ncbi:dienelactone hydrolase family protein [Silvanigrella aquatica]|uniref:Carboxymethylenebutenolidase n=1 Tax=Silvanigrella aquatica TaxID=1915309 RepID=A0A1L4D115_9BACT|nr:dienelactone hydrolase family protein [Silvanigrella aquatica]APJ03886.1 carboxymethylenebutenolidase [Silvanigrella aquatica]
MDKDLSSQSNQMNRRDFVYKTVAAAGFALAVLPIAHSAIMTDTEGIEAKDVKIPVGKLKIPAYQAMPKGTGPFPVLMISHEIFGLHEFIRDLCRRFAKLGFFAIAPDLYYRQGDVTKIKEIPDIIAKVVSKVTNEQVNGDLDATVKYLGSTKRANLDKITMTGFCWGGKATWLYAAHNPKIKSAIAWYGPLVPGPQQGNQKAPQMPIDIAATLKVPVLGLYGGKDTYITKEHVEQMEEVLDKGSSGSKIILYPDADHGFFADYRPTYNKDASDDALKQMLDWIKSH